MEKIATQFVTTISVNGHFLMDDLGEDQASSLFSMKNPRSSDHINLSRTSQGRTPQGIQSPKGLSIKGHEAVKGKQN
ncbi:hypothetical protein PSTG_16721 [Puccinia striiformis f. sp. tritici PST-78]|uniref:Uncharacterized protein n=1 Tax=Puccinia striiformis f. sp. tritici PST-78 TaxID=1165861 RepID=A0A0L0USB8_9BASI|nr:hypothetical protein PSTG_16721 [Puccinia striiformis f. sp. tritici PST-78]